MRPDEQAAFSRLLEQGGVISLSGAQESIHGRYRTGHYWAVRCPKWVSRWNREESRLGDAGNEHGRARQDSNKQLLFVGKMADCMRGLSRSALQCVVIRGREGSGRSNLWSRGWEVSSPARMACPKPCTATSSCFREEVLVHFALWEALRDQRGTER